MAALTTRKNGHKEIQWRTAEGRRPCLRLGKISQAKAEEFKLFIDRILRCQKAELCLDVASRTWIAGLAPVMVNRLIELGVIDDRSRSVQSLEQLLDYCLNQLEVQESTLITYQNVRDNLIDFFGHVRAIASMSEGDAKEFQRWLRKEGNRLTGNGLSEATVSKRCQIAKQFFGMAVDKCWLTKNAFRCLKCGPMHNPDRQEFVERAVVDQIMDAAVDDEWRLIVALARYGGLRCPSEVMKLRWEWVNWEKDTIQVFAPKTAHHREHKWRTIPVFWELRPYLEAVWEAAPVGACYVIHHRRLTNQALRSEMLRTIGRAGLNPWPRLWQNLRASRETELQDEFPIKCVTSWIGNSETIAKKHYLQVTKDHHNRAVLGGRSQAQSKAQSKVAGKRETEGNVAGGKTKNAEKMPASPI